jgi:hypothetical protein
MLWREEQTASSGADAELMQLRWLCNLVLGTVPDQGIIEALESLVRISEFYSLPAPSWAPQVNEPPRLLRAKVSRRAERPAFSLPEE